MKAVHAMTLVAVLGLSACETMPPEEDPVQIKLNDVDTRLGRVESVVNNQSLLELSRRIDALEVQSRQLRGGVEETQNGNEAVRKQQRDLYADLDRRLKTLESAGQRADAGLGASLPAGAPLDDQTAYNRAFERLKAGEYGSAITQFRDFMAAYPSSGLLDNAQYWIGEAFYVTRDYDQALAAFRAVGERWPDSPKAADALLKTGYTQFEQKQLSAARATLQQVQQRYPGSEAARLAGERLARLPPEGR